LSSAMEKVLQKEQDNHCQKKFKWQKVFSFTD
jgi:hypothetical protein